MSQFLAENAASPAIKYVKHAPISTLAQRGDGDKLFFITARDPLSQYQSLYFYGCRGNGRTFRQIARSEYDHLALYDGTEAGFARWLMLIATPGGRDIIAELYPPECAELYGPVTFCFLYLSFVTPARKLPKWLDRDRLPGQYEKKRLHRHVLRCESLNDDLAALAEGDLAPFLRDPGGAAARLRESRERRNSNSKRKPITVSNELKALVQEREWFMYDVLGYPRYV
ncbi:MAG: hypothetical protein H7X93_03040 [Sphingomonadaceae bacterium]|nr:hypothetical protein [Sphingomonadaceae bacterium]